MDTIWDCMNIASRISKQIDNTGHLVPKSQSVAVDPVNDLQELTATVNLVRTTLVPFVTSAKKTKVVGDASFEICIKSVKDTLSHLFQFFKDLEREFSMYTWKTQKVKIYQMDFSLKQKLDQFAALFNPNDVAEGKDKKSKEKSPSPASLISDVDGREMWIKSFGEGTMMVPWKVFLTTLESYLGGNLRQDEESLKMFIDFTNDDHVSSYEWGVFLKWFSPLKGACARATEALHGGLLCGFVPAVEANLLLEGKKEGTYLVRCSKTTPGSFAVTFVDHAGKPKHCLLYNVHPHGLTLKSPPTVYESLKTFADSHTTKLKHPLGNKWTLKNKLKGFEYDGKLSEENDKAAAEEDDNESNLCIVCMDNPVETVFLECGHLACCKTCGKKLNQCPICRNTITRVINIFRAT